MTKQQATEKIKANLNKLIKEEGYKCSDEAREIIEHLLEEDDPEKAYDEDGFVNDSVDGELIYYDDAMDYLNDNNIHDFEDAIELGLTNSVDFARYYLTEEVFEMLYEIKFFSEYDEVDEDEEDGPGCLTGRNHTAEEAAAEAEFKRYMELTGRNYEEDEDEEQEESTLDEKIYIAEEVAEFERYIEKISEKIGDPELTEALKKLKNGLK